MGNDELLRLFTFLVKEFYENSLILSSLNLVTFSFTFQVWVYGDVQHNCVLNHMAGDGFGYDQSRCWLRARRCRQI